MTVKALRDALPYNADDATVLIGTVGSAHGEECEALAVLQQTNNSPNPCVLIIAAEPKKKEVLRQI